MGGSDCVGCVVNWKLAGRGTRRLHAAMEELVLEIIPSLLPQLVLLISMLLAATQVYTAVG